MSYWFQMVSWWFGRLLSWLWRRINFYHNTHLCFFEAHEHILEPREKTQAKFFFHVIKVACPIIIWISHQLWVYSYFVQNHKYLLQVSQASFYSSKMTYTGCCIQQEKKTKTKHNIRSHSSKIQKTTNQLFIRRSIYLFWAIFFLHFLLLPID